MAIDVFLFLCIIRGWLGDLGVILEPSDVCENQFNVLDLNSVNKCQRKLFDWWTPIIVTKLIMITFHAFYLWVKAKCRTHPRIIGMKSKNQLVSKLIKKVKRNVDKWTVDGEYSVLVTKLELSIMFMTISPYVMIVCALSLLINRISFRILTNRYNYHITNWHYQKFPFAFIFISLCFQQFMLMMFWWNIFDTFDAFIAKVLLFVAFVCMDLAFCVFAWMRPKNVQIDD